MINIIYVSSCCSPDKFERLRKEGITKKLPQAQKYHRLLIEGLALNKEVTVRVVAAYPTNRSWSKKVYFKHDKDFYEGIEFNYVSLINLPILSQASKYCNAKRVINSLVDPNAQNYIVCDILNQSLSRAAIKIGEKNNIMVLGIVTDVPGHTSGARRKSYNFLKRKIFEFAESRSEKLVKTFDSYLFLTEAMNDVVNMSKKPFIVIEGQADIKLNSVFATQKAKPKVMMYAGGIHEEFGIKRMVEAFCRAHVAGWELHIYGDGNFQNRLVQISKENPTVFYHGVVANEDIVKNQMEATLLVNPRLTDAEYVKYSFPSKTMECMASGTPLLTTKLPGMPKEYYPHVLFFEDESEDGMTRTFEKILRMNDDELSIIGNRAKKFVLKEKNNIIQSNKVIEFLKKNG